MKLNKKIIGLLSLSLMTGCVMPKIKGPQISFGKSYTPPDLDLTLIHVEMPKRYIDSFSRAELSFSTNGLNQTHAIFNSYLTQDMAERIKSVPLGTKMKESKWNNFLLNHSPALKGRTIQRGNWQRFY